MAASTGTGTGSYLYEPAGPGVACWHAGDRDKGKICGPPVQIPMGAIDF